MCFSEFSQALVRLTKMIRGMGDPLVAVYSRTYICRVSSNNLLDEDVKDLSLNCFVGRVLNAIDQVWLLLQPASSVRVTPEGVLLLFLPANII